jgi:HD superfamily phosphohydrolase
VSYQRLHTRSVKDSVYTEPVKFTLDFWKYIDNPVFARLKDLSQLGTLHNVFPGATHTRFAHSLGVGHLAQRQMNFLLEIKDQQQQGYTQNATDYNIDQTDVRNVTMAGLVHDLGHGPFSHLFDRGVVPTLLKLQGLTSADINSWEHEHASEMLFKYMIDEYNLDVEADELDPEFISRLVHGKPAQKDEGKEWMFEVVANKRNSFDVDKLDYLCRDNYHCGLNQQQGNQDYINFEQIIKNSRVVGNKIAYNIKAVNNVKMVYDHRFEMFRAVYNHKIGQAIDLMYQDILVKADPVYNFLQDLNNPARYVHLTDSIVQRIRRSTDPKLKESQQILERVQRRELYQQVDGFHLQDCKWREYFNAQDIVSHCKTGNLTADDIILLPTKYDYGCGTSYPIDKMTFYRNDNNLEILDRVNDFEYALSKPKRNQEAFMRIFVRNPEKIEDAQAAFRAYCSKMNPEWVE